MDLEADVLKSWKPQMFFVWGSLRREKAVWLTDWKFINDNLIVSHTRQWDYTESESVMLR